eukprot:9298379-Prorocentrum_lima.AAC.1
MTSSLVGSEMCIRDRRSTTRQQTSANHGTACLLSGWMSSGKAGDQSGACLLYTSDAADDM